MGSEMCIRDRQSPPRGGDDSASGSDVARQLLVYHLVGAVDSPPSSPARSSRSSSASGSLAPQPRDVQAGGMADMREALRGRGIPEEAVEVSLAALSKSSHSVYQHEWQEFVSWCSERDIDPTHAPIADILQFLQFKFDQGCAFNTLKSYVAALGHFVSLDGGGESWLPSLDTDLP